jgi:hypothetical protein
VLAILLVVAGATSPVVVSLMADHRMRESTEMVRAALAATRIHAVDENGSYQFRFEVGGTRFLAVAVDDLSDADDPAGSGEPLPPSEFGELVDGLRFEVGAVAVSSATPLASMPASASDPQWEAATARAGYPPELTSATWSEPIVFRYDGTATDCTFRIMDSRNQGCQIRVRELTGDVRVSAAGDETEPR